MPAKYWQWNVQRYYTAVSVSIARQPYTAVTGVSIVSHQVSIVVGVTTDNTHLPMSEYMCVP